LSWDIPKGHCEPHESLLQTALRELVEETNVSSTDVRVDQKFVYENVYYPYYKRFKQKVQKTLTVFLGFVRLKAHIKVKISKEHTGHKWFDWKLPHTVPNAKIDELLRCVDKYVRANKQVLIPTDHHDFADSKHNTQLTKKKK